MKKLIQKISCDYLPLIEKISFGLFLLTFPLSIRKILFYYPIAEAFNEYTAVFLYLSDIFLFVTLFSWLLILYNNYCFLSTNITAILKCFTWNNWIKKMKNIVSRGTISNLKKSYPHIINKYLLFFPLVATFFSFFSILWATSPSIAFFRSLKLLEFVFLFYYIIFRFVPRGTNILRFDKLFHMEQYRLNSCNSKNTNCKYANCSTWNNYIFILALLIFGGVINSLTAIIQILKQKSIGLFWLKESIISSNLPGVAKIILHNQTFIRAYGLLPHPNILGGLLAFSIVATIAIQKLFHVEQRNMQICSTWNNKFPTNYNFTHVSRGTIIKFFLLIQLVALLLTVSKSAFFGLLTAFICLNSIIVSRGTMSSRIKKILFKPSRKYILLFFAFFTLILALRPSLNSLIYNSFAERIALINVSRETIMQHPLIGNGSGQFVPTMAKNSSYLAWQYQPVHNVYLLILNDLGLFLLIGFIIFILGLLYLSISNTQSIPANIDKGDRLLFMSNYYLTIILITFVFIMQFDHYLWDIQQGQVIFWITCALILAISRKKNILI